MSLQEIDSLPSSEIETWRVFAATVCPISDDSWLQSALIRHSIYQTHAKGYRGNLYDLLPRQFKAPAKSDDEIGAVLASVVAKQRRLTK